MSIMRGRKIAKIEKKDHGWIEVGKRVSARDRWRMEQVARMKGVGCGDGEIGKVMGVSGAVVGALRRRREYEEVEAGVRLGMVTEMEWAMAESLEGVKEVLRTRIPEAMKILGDSLRDERAEIRLRAAEKIFDLDGRLGSGGVQVAVGFRVGEGDREVALAVLKGAGGE